MFDENFEIHRPITARTIKFALSTLRSLFQTNYWYFNRLFFYPGPYIFHSHSFSEKISKSSAATYFLAVAKFFRKVSVENVRIHFITTPTQKISFISSLGSFWSRINSLENYISYKYHIVWLGSKYRISCHTYKVSLKLSSES